jgi:hypothetical protein
MGWEKGEEEVMQQTTQASALHKYTSVHHISAGCWAQGRSSERYPSQGKG